VYRLIERIESGSQWAPNEVLIACEGLCSNYLGIGDEPERVAVEPKLLSQIRSRLKTPSITMFKELKASVTAKLEELYANFIDSGAQVLEKKSSQSSLSRTKGASSPRKKDSVKLTTSTSAGASSSGSSSFVPPPKKSSSAGLSTSLPTIPSPLKLKK